MEILDFLPTAEAGGFLSRMRHVPQWRGLPIRGAGVGVFGLAARLACHIDDALHLQHLLRRRGPPLFVHLGQFAARPGQFVGQGLAWVRRPRGRRGA